MADDKALHPTAKPLVQWSNQPAAGELSPYATTFDTIMVTLRLPIILPFVTGRCWYTTRGCNHRIRSSTRTCFDWRHRAGVADVLVVHPHSMPLWKLEQRF